MGDMGLTYYGADIYNQAHQTSSHQYPTLYSARDRVSPVFMDRQPSLTLNKKSSSISREKKSMFIRKRDSEAEIKINNVTYYP